MAKIQITAEITEVERLAGGVFSMELYVPQIAQQAVPGQFISVYCKDRDRLLPRPISLCGIDREKGLLRLVYRIVGNGTKEFSRMQPGEEILVMGPLGNGFPICQEEHSGKSVILLGGGIGIPPMLSLAKSFPGSVTTVLGYRDAETFLLEEFRKTGSRVIVATEDGSVGIKGNVIDAVYEENVKGDVIYACGPLPMLRGVKQHALKEGIPAWVSMEERMACGIGACLACVCQSKETDSHSHVKNKRVCKDGPVFLATDVELG